MGLDIDIFRFPKSGDIGRKNVYGNRNYNAYLIAYFRKFYPLEWLASHTYNTGWIDEGFVDAEITEAGFRLFRIHINKLINGYEYQDGSHHCSINTIDKEKLFQFKSLVDWCLTQPFDLYTFYYSSCP